MIPVSSGPTQPRRHRAAKSQWLNPLQRVITTPVSSLVLPRRDTPVCRHLAMRARPAGVDVSNLAFGADYAAPQLLVPDFTRALGQAIVMTPRLRRLPRSASPRQRLVMRLAPSTCFAISGVRSAHPRWRPSSPNAKILDHHQPAALPCRRSWREHDLLAGAGIDRHHEHEPSRSAWPVGCRGGRDRELHAHAE